MQSLIHAGVKVKPRKKKEAPGLSHFKMDMYMRIRIFI